MSSESFLYVGLGQRNQLKRGKEHTRAVSGHNSEGCLISEEDFGKDVQMGEHLHDNCATNGQSRRYFPRPRRETENGLESRQFSIAAYHMLMG